MNNSIHALSSSFLLTYNAHFRKIHSLRYFPHRRYTVGILSAHEIRKTDAWTLYAQYIGFFIWPWRSYSVV